MGGPYRGSARSGAGRDPARALLGWTLLLGIALLVVLAGTAATVREPAGAAETRQGGELYQRWCATCHANDGGGTTAGPAIDDFSVAAVDLSMRTGRMPLTDPQRGVRGRTLTDGEREAVVAYLTDLVGLQGELPEPRAGDVAAGRDVYAVHCAHCHGATGTGGVGGAAVAIPPVQGLDPVTIASATRVGPFEMPRFDAELVSDEEIGDIVAFLDEATHERTSPLGLGELSKFEAAVFAAVLGVGLLGVSAWAGGARSRHRRDQRQEDR